MSSAIKNNGTRSTWFDKDRSICSTLDALTAVGYAFVGSRLMTMKSSTIPRNEIKAMFIARLSVFSAKRSFLSGSSGSTRRAVLSLIVNMNKFPLSPREILISSSRNVVSNAPRAESGACISSDPSLNFLKATLAKEGLVGCRTLKRMNELK